MSEESAPTVGIPLDEAEIDGIGARTAQRLADAGITTVEQLADLDVDDAVDVLTPHFGHWRPETLRAHVADWVVEAASRAGDPAPRPRSHVFLLTLWTDEDGRPVRSRFAHRNPDEPTAEETAREIAGWSPLAFVDFVERIAQLTDATALGAVPRADQELVEWSRHRLSGSLVRANDTTVVMRVRLPQMPEHAGERTGFRWRASAWLRPLAGGPVVDLGRLNGTAEAGEVVEQEFAIRVPPDQLHRAWFDVALDPPADAAVELVDAVPVTA